MSSTFILWPACMVLNKKGVYFSTWSTLLTLIWMHLFAGLISPLKVICKLVYDDGSDNPSQLIWKLSPSRLILKLSWYNKRLASSRWENNLQGRYPVNSADGRLSWNLHCHFNSWTEAAVWTGNSIEISPGMTIQTFSAWILPGT
jgi:hypothetical protein